MGLGSPDSLWVPTPYATCGHGDRQTFFMVIEYIKTDGLEAGIQHECGRYCQPCGVEIATEIPPDAGEVTIRIFDWQGDGMVVTVRSPQAAAKEASAA